MTTVEILYRYTTPPTEGVSIALAGARDVYGIRHLEINQKRGGSAWSLTRPAEQRRGDELVRETGLEIAEELPLIPPVVTAPEA